MGEHLALQYERHVPTPFARSQQYMIRASLVAAAQRLHQGGMDEELSRRQYALQVVAERQIARMTSN
jgi:hypothetical protein